MAKYRQFSRRNDAARDAILDAALARCSETLGYVTPSGVEGQASWAPTPAVAGSADGRA